MGDDGGDGTSASGEELLGCLDERSGADREVVDDHGVAAFDVADDLDDLGILVVAAAHLVRDRERRVEPVREPACTLRESGIGRDDDRIAQLDPLDRRAQVGKRVEVVDGDPEEALDL